MKLGAAIAAILVCASASEANADNLLERIFKENPERYSAVLNAQGERRVQVQLTEIDTRAPSRPLRQHAFRVGAEYLYPASALKHAAAIAAIIRVQSLAGAKAPPINLRAPITLSSSTDRDDVSTTSLAAALRKTLIVSSNRAYNVLYDVSGQCWLNETMWRAGLKDVRLNHRLSRILSLEENRRTPAWRTEQHGVTIEAPAQRCTRDLSNTLSKRLSVGRAYLDKGTLVESPMHFGDKNHMGVASLHNLLLVLVHPTHAHGLNPLPLREPHRRALLDALRTLPHESPWPRWSRAKYDPYRFKPFLRGLERVRALNELRVTSKAGKAYGFRIDNAHIEELKTGRAFVLTAGLHVDMDGTLNDDRYDYELADDFLAKLAEDVARNLFDTPTRSSR